MSLFYYSGKARAGEKLPDPQGSLTKDLIHAYHCLSTDPLLVLCVFIQFAPSKSSTLESLFKRGKRSRAFDP